MPEINAPAWSSSSPSLLTIRVASGESLGWIAERTDALLRHLQVDFDVPVWNVPMDAAWDGSLEALARLVQRNAVRGLVSQDQVDEVIPGEGYSFTVSGVGPRVAPLVSIAAGSDVVGRRLPARRLSVQLRETAVGGLDARAADAVCAAVITTWDPATAEFADLSVRRLARRGNWKIGVGYRTWISFEVGGIDQIADGLTKSELAGGTMIAAPDNWTAELVVAAMTETLAVNGLDEVPH